MTAALADIRENVRKDLRDDSDVNYTDAQLERAIAEAVDEYGRARPQQTTATITVTGRSADLSAAAPGGLGSTVYAQLVRVVAAEYPIDLYPPAYLRFDRWGANLTFHTDDELSAESVKLSLELTHTLTSGTSTIPDPDGQLLALGAAGFAQRQLAAEAAVSLTLNRDQVAHLRQLAEERLERFRRRLRGSIRQGQLYRPADPYLSRDIVGFPE